jgi:hypothetical protein
LDVKNDIIESDIFNILHKRLVDNSPEPPKRMVAGDYHSIGAISCLVHNLLVSNPTGVKPFLDSPLIPVLNWTLESSMSLLDTSSDKNLKKIFRYICASYLKCIVLPFENTSHFIELKGVDAMLSVVEKYVTQIRENRKRLDEDGVEYASITIFNIANYGSTHSEDGKVNLAKKQFEENNKFSRLVDLCKFLISQQPSSPEQRCIADHNSLAICRLLKSERPPLSFGSILAYIDNPKSSPPHPNGFDISLTARDAWKEMVVANECLSSFKK